MQENSVKKILIIRLGAIGDVVNSTIIAQAIKTAYPQYVIHFITASYICPLLENNPYLGKVIPVDMQRKDNIPYLIQKGLELRKEKYDYIINLTNSLRNSVLIKTAAPKHLIKRSARRVHAVDAFFNTVGDVFDNLKMPESIKLGVDKKLQARFRQELEGYPKPVVILSPGGDNDKQRQGRIWDDEYWIKLGNMLVEKYNASVLIIGSKTEAPAHKQFSQIKNSYIYSGKLSLKETAALITLCDLFISGDSGPLHLADAVGAKSIALMGSTHPRSSSPYSKNGVFIGPSISCRYCGEKRCKLLGDGEKIAPCMLSIKPEQVMKLIETNGYFK